MIDRFFNVRSFYRLYLNNLVVIEIAILSDDRPLRIHATDPDMLIFSTSDTDSDTRIRPTLLLGLRVATRYNYAVRSKSTNSIMVNPRTLSTSIRPTGVVRTKVDHGIMRKLVTIGLICLLNFD